MEYFLLINIMNDDLDDPVVFDEEFSSENNNLQEHFNYISVSVQQRNTKKTWTIVSNINEKDERKKELLQKIKRKLNCNGSIDENGNLRFNGNHKDEIADILIQELKITKIQIRTH